MRTGTNYISCILQDNFIDCKVFMNVGGWKHGKIILIPDNKTLVNTVDVELKKNIEKKTTIDLFINNRVNFIVIIKNPYMWIQSICKFERSAAAASKKIKDELYVIQQIKLWNEMYLDYKQYIESGKAHLIKYEILLQEPNKVVEDLIKKFNLTRNFKNSLKLEKYELKANSDRTIGEHNNKVFDSTKYINPTISTILPKNIINIINNNIDLRLMNFYKYDLEKIE